MSGTSLLPPTLLAEDSPAPSGGTGTLVSALVGGISDVDGGSLTGIAITATNTTNGTLWYSTNGGSSWDQVSTVSTTSALLLTNSASTRLYYQPAANYNGTTADALTFRAWDTTTGSAGTKVDPGVGGGTSAFSTNTDTVAVTVSAVNDAPTITNGALYSLPTTNEDTNSSAVSASAILTAANWADIDAGAASGLAITSTTGLGNWQFSTNGTTWTNFGSVSSTNALLITAATQVRYAPDQENGETATFSFRAWDQFSGTASSLSTARYANPGSGGGITAYSANTGSAQIVVSSVNDAPGFNLGGTLPAVAEDTASPAGAALSALGITTTDVDTGSSNAGYAIIANSANSSAQGTWQYSTNSGTNWFAIGSVSDGSDALALSADTLVRFVPVADFNGAPPALSIRALDNTYAAGFSSTVGSESRVTVSTTTTGSSTAISSATATISTSITPVNDAPTLDATQSPALTTLAEDSPAPSGGTGTLVSDLVGGISDVDSGALKGIAITATNTTNGTLWYSTNGGSSWVQVSTVSTTSALLLTDSASTRLYYQPAANYYGTTADALTFRAWDTTTGSAGTKVDPGAGGGNSAFSTNTDTVAVTVSAVNDAPLATGTSTLAAVGEDTSAPTGASVRSLFLPNYDNSIDGAGATTLQAIAIVGNAATPGQGRWQYSANAGSSWSDVPTSGLSDTSALVLQATEATGETYRLRFLPAADYNGTPGTLAVRLADGSSLKFRTLT
jgi:hypothetical protein